MARAHQEQIDREATDHIIFQHFGSIDVLSKYTLPDNEILEYISVKPEMKQLITLDNKGKPCGKRVKDRYRLVTHLLSSCYQFFNKNWMSIFHYFIQVTSI